MPAYNNNTPLATQPINQTQAPIQTNFATLQTSFDVNHVDFASADFGKHKWVTFPAQNPVDPQAAINNPDIGLYNAVYNGNEELWYRNSTNVVTDIPFTASLYSANGWTYLPSGLIIKWGFTGIVNAETATNITAAQGPIIPSSQILTVLLTPNGNNVTTSRDLVFRGVTGTDNQFSVYSRSGLVAPGGSYLLIGYQV